MFVICLAFVLPSGDCRIRRVPTASSGVHGRRVPTASNGVHGGRVPTACVYITDMKTIQKSE